MKKRLPVAAAVLCGLLALTDFLIPNVRLDVLGAILAEGVTILAAFALLLGVLNILAVHTRRIVSSSQLETGSRMPSGVLIVSLLFTLAIGIASSGTRPSMSAALTWIFDYVYHPLQATMAALLAFFVVSAMYRAFRLRSLEAVMLTASSLVMLFVQLPFAASISPLVPVIREWILDVPVTAAARGIIIGVALGTLATSLRVLLAVDRPYSTSPIQEAE